MPVTMFWNSGGQGACESRSVMKLLRMDDDYCVAVPPDPTDEEMEGVWATLRGLTRQA